MIPWFLTFEYLKEGNEVHATNKTYIRTQNTDVISDMCHAINEPIFITKDGYGDLVVMGLEAYEAMLDENTLDRCIAQAEDELLFDGKLLDAREALGTLRRRFTPI